LGRLIAALLLVVRGVDPEKAEEHLKRALVRFREVGDAHRLATTLHIQGVLLMEQERSAEAREALEQTLEVCAATNDGFREASCLAYLAGIAMQEHKIDEACAHAERAVRTFAVIGERWQRGLALGTQGAALGMRGDVMGSSNALDRAEAQLAALGDTVYIDAIRVHRGQLDLARARKCHEQGDVAGAERHRKAAEARLAAADERTDDVRIAARLLRRSLESAPGGELDAPPSDDALVVADDGSWFRPPFGKRVELGNRKNQRLLLQALAEHRIASPGEPLSPDALLARGWPGERVLPEAGVNRVRVAMVALRQLGLRDVIKSHDEGYFLDASVPITTARKKL
jgi:tetratricopeptide (TPR) repeat protein